jgi:hypothetical protein
MNIENPFVKKRKTVSEIFENDPDKLELYNKIVDLLISAGYFRARIQNLEPFDKLLGGMAWTLTGCFYDIDIDFKDDMNLTEKIRVSEKITAGLKSINCPFLLNPVQITRFDLKPVYECLQWLVKKLKETQDERNEMNKKFSVNFIESKMKDKQNLIVIDNEEILKGKYNLLKQNRKYKQKNKLNFDYNDELRVFFSMIEYGMNKDITFQRQLIELLRKKNLIGDSKEKKNSNLQKEKNSDNNKLTKDEMKTLNDIIETNIEEIQDKEKNKVNASIIEAIFSENMQTIAKEIENFDNSKGDENIDKIKLYAKEKERLEKNKANISSQLIEFQNEYNNMILSSNAEKEEINNLKKEIEQLENNKRINLDNKDKIINKVKEEKLSEEKMKFLSEKNKEKDQLKNEISKFKKECLAEKNYYDSQLENYQKKIDKLNNSENEQFFNEIDTNYNNELQANLEKKKDLFNQNKVINMLTRKIQLYPSKLEVIQYQKRFGELYDQLNNVTEKSQKILGECNSKNQVVQLLEQKENAFIELKNFYNGFKKMSEKEQVKNTIINIYNPLVPMINNSNQKLKDINCDIDSYQKTLNDLRMYESNYMKLIKDYNKEFNKYNAMNQ